jgi:hypothetical protein
MNSQSVDSKSVLAGGMSDKSVGRTDHVSVLQACGMHRSLGCPANARIARPLSRRGSLTTRADRGSTTESPTPQIIAIAGRADRACGRGWGTFVSSEPTH